MTGEQGGESRPYPPGFDPEREVLLDSRSLRGIAHPLRTRILGLLRVDGPSTATRLAERLNLSSAATSYHLRQLAAYGFVVEDESRGTGRERWWRAAHQSTRFERSLLEAEAGPEGPDREETDVLAGEYLRVVAAASADKVRAWLDGAHALPAEWQDASTMSDSLLALTTQESARLIAEIDAVVARYRRHDAPDVPAGARRVSMQWQVFPWAPR